MSPPHNSFSTDEYWEKWYSYNTDVYDWLMGADFFDEHILHGNKAKFDANTMQQVLNIGSGTSMLPFHLDRILDHDIQIHNIDFAYEAVEWGKAKTPEENIARGPSKMSFEQGSLLDHPTLLRLYTPRRIDLILDKGTSDAIACGHHLTYTFSPAVSLLSQKKVSPLIIMALNLAVIAATGSRWLCLSLFARRFPFMSWRYHHAVDRLGRGFPRPSTYWRIVKCQRIERDSETSCFMYTLERKDVELPASVIMDLELALDRP